MSANVNSVETGSCGNVIATRAVVSVVSSAATERQMAARRMTAAAKEKLGALRRRNGIIYSISVAQIARKCGVSAAQRGHGAGLP